VDIEASLTDFNYKWKPGVRVGAGRYIDGIDDWDFLVVWTYYHGKGVGNASAVANLPGVITSTITESAAYNLNYNVFDLEFGHSFFLKDQVIIRPVLGFRGVIIDQDYRANVLEASGAVTFGLLGFDGLLKTEAENEFTGAGIRGGARLIWELIPQLGILGQFSGSVLIGEFDLTAKVFADLSVGISDTDTATVLGTNKVSSSFYKVRTNLEGLFGLYSKWPCRRDKDLLELTLGYEIAVWFHQNQLNQFLSSLSSLTGLSPISLFGISPTPLDSQARNLALRGLTFNIRYSF